MWRVSMLALLVACRAGGGDDEFPIEPGGTPGTGTMVDAAVVDAPDFDAMSMIAGRVCLIADLRALTACASTGAGGITVTLGASSAITSDSGEFTIAAPSGANLVWRASAGDLVTSVVPFGPSTLIPAIGVEDFNDLQNANGVLIVDGQGSIVARVVKGGLPQSDVVVDVAPLAQFPTRYDGLTPTAWTELATGPAGTAWIPGAALGTNIVTATPAAGAAASATVLVEDLAITYVTIALP